MVKAEEGALPNFIARRANILDFTFFRFKSTGFLVVAN